MSMTKKDKDALQANWTQARNQVDAEFPGLTTQDLESDVDQLSTVISDRLGSDKAEVEKSLKQIAQSYNVDA